MSSHRRTSDRVPGARRRRHRAARKRRVRIALTGAAALAVVSGGTAFACMGQGHPGHRPHEAAASHAPSHTSWTHVPSHPAHGPHPRPTATATGGPHPTARPTTASPSPSRTRPAPPPMHGSSPAPSASATGAPAAGDAVQQVLDLVNQARAAQGLAPYTLMDGLNRSAAAHNQVMASGCGLSHQCPGEAAFGDRETAAGVHWTSAGENIGTGGPVADDQQAIAAMAVRLTQSMLDEKPPDDGHRRNILSSSFTRIGIAVHRDASGSVWMTQDFAQPR